MRRADVERRWRRERPLIVMIIIVVVIPIAYVVSLGEDARWALVGLVPAAVAVPMIVRGTIMSGRRRAARRGVLFAGFANDRRLEAHYGLLEVTPTEIVWSQSRWTRHFGRAPGRWQIAVSEIDSVTVGRPPPMVMGAFVDIQWNGGGRQLQVDDREGLEAALRQAGVLVRRIG